MTNQRLIRSTRALLLALPLWIPFGSAGAQAPAASPRPPASNTGDQLLAPLSSYEENQSGVTGKLTLYPYALGASLIFTAQGASNAIVPLDVQAQLLSPLLDHFFRDHPDIKGLHVRLGGNREALFPALGQALAKSKAWDSLRGRPVHGQLGAVLIETFNRANVAGPLAQAFKVHGFTLSLTTVGRIDIQKDPHSNGARLPVHIDDMEFQAVRLPR